MITIVIKKKILLENKKLIKPVVAGKTKRNKKDKTTAKTVTRITLNKTSLIQFLIEKLSKNCIKYNLTILPMNVDTIRPQTIVQGGKFNFNKIQDIGIFNRKTKLFII